MKTTPQASVSVVITAYNHARFITETLDSVLAQDIPKLEIIVVDDGSKDETLSIAQSYTDRGIIVFTKPNGGPSSAVNAGIARATGDIIVLLSADDVLLPHSIAWRCEALALNNADVVSASPIWINEEGRQLQASEYPPVFQHPGRLTPLEMFKKLFFGGNFICAPSVAITRRCLDAVGTFDEALWQLQDYEYWLRASAKGFAFSFLEQPLIKYRMHGNNLSVANPKRLKNEIEQVLGRAASMLCISDMQALLFGDGFRDEDLDIDAASLSYLLLLRSKNHDISQSAVSDLELHLSDRDTYKRFAACFSAGL